jgi:hypothetical protein
MQIYEKNLKLQSLLITVLIKPPLQKNFRIDPEALSIDDPFSAAGRNPGRDDNAGGTEIMAGVLV